MPRSLLKNRHCPFGKIRLDEQAGSFKEKQDVVMIGLIDCFCRKSIIPKMISEYIQKKLKTASYKILKDKTYFGEIKDIRGVWANAKNLEKCREELREVLEDWIVLQIKSGNKISGLPLNFDRRRNFSHA